MPPTPPDAPPPVGRPGTRTRPDRGDPARQVDVAIVGAGVAGLYAAICLPAGLDVSIIDKGTPGRSGSSPWAQGGLAAPLGPDDSAERHARDTIAAGDGACDEVAVRVLTREIPDHVETLLHLGARFDGCAGDSGDLGDLRLAREGGHAVARSVHTADATGAELVRVLRAAAAPRTERLEGLAVRLATTGSGRICGVWVLRDGEILEVRARAVLLATGGCGALFAATTNQEGSTGDGVTLAVEAGAAVRDLEFVQFHPTALAAGGTRRFLLTEALRGAGATLHDDDGGRFLVGVHPDAELAPRDVVATAMVERPGGAWLDATGLGRRTLEEEFPTALRGARERGFDLATERVPVSPAAHYMVGGVRTDLSGRTTRQGLYAAGEVASTGVHGANRLAGNSLSEALVFGARAAATIETELPPPPPDPEPPVLSEATGSGHTDRLGELRQLMWEHAGPLRSADGLERAGRSLAELARKLGPPSVDLRHAELALATAAARLIVAAAAARPESRGGHRRADHPRGDPAWVGVHLERTSPLPR